MMVTAYKLELIRMDVRPHLSTVNISSYTNQSHIFISFLYNSIHFLEAGDTFRYLGARETWTCVRKEEKTKCEG